MKICLKDYVFFLQKKTYLGRAKVRLSPLKGKNKILWKKMVYSMRKNKLGHMVSMQITINQTDPSGSRYGPKRDDLVCAKPNRHILTYISGWGGRFELSFFALKPSVLAECCKPYVFTILIFTL